MAEVKKATEPTMTLREKLMHIQEELKAPKNLHNNFGGYNYRNAESILEALKPLLAKYGATVTITDSIEEIGGRIYVKATASIWDIKAKESTAINHEGLTISKVESIEVNAYAREAETKKGMDEAQITGATSSYARKYALNGLFLLDDTEDVDSEAYQKGAEPTQSTPKKPNNKTTPKQTAKPAEAKPEPKAEPTRTGARAELHEFIKVNGLDGKTIAQVCGLNAESTEDDYLAALVLARTMVEEPTEV